MSIFIFISNPHGLYYLALTVLVCVRIAVQLKVLLR